MELFFEKEPLLNVLSLTNMMLQRPTLVVGRLAILTAIPLKDDGTPDIDASFGCRRRGEHSIPEDDAPLALLLEQAIDATTSAAALEMCRRATSLSEEEQTQLEAELATTSALLILSGAFARRTADRGRRRRS